MAVASASIIQLPIVLMLPLLVNTWVTAAPPTVNTPAGTTTATVNVTIVTVTATTGTTGTTTATNDVATTTVKGNVIPTEGMAEIGGKGAARLEGTVRPRVLGAGAVTAGALLAEVAVARPSLAPMTTTALLLTPTEGGKLVRRLVF